MLDFAKVHVNPGEPVTATAWNNIVDALFEVQQILLAAGGTAAVRITNAGLDVTRVRVTATHDTHPPAEALRPIPPGNDFIFPRLAPGAYEIRVEGPGFDPFVGAVTVADDGTVSPKPLEVALTQSGTFMPNVYGLKLPEAITALGAAQVKILDVSGKSLPKSGFDAEYNNAAVLVQWPLPAAVIPPTGVFMVVSAGLVVQPLAAVPDLAGKTFNQAKAALEALGLKIHQIP